MLALALLVFAFAYGAPANAAAHAWMADLSAGSGCPAGDHPSGPAARAGERSGTSNVTPGCIAHCLPAAPIASADDAFLTLAGGADPPISNERGEGLTLAVPLPPPRPADRA